MLLSNTRAFLSSFFTLKLAEIANAQVLVQASKSSFFVHNVHHSIQGTFSVAISVSTMFLRKWALVS